MPNFRDYSLDLAHYVRIEGIGIPNGAGTDTLSLYVFDRLPDNNWTPAASQRFITGLELAGGFSQRSELPGGVADIDKIAFTVQELPALSADGASFWAAILAHDRIDADTTTYPTTELTAPMLRGDTVATVRNTAAFPATGPLWIGNECMQYTGTTPTTFTGMAGVNRGRHPATGNSHALSHRVETDSDGNVLQGAMVSTRPTSMFGRRVAVYAVARGRDGIWEAAGSAVRRYTGFVRSVDYLPERNGFRFHCDPLTRILDRSVFTRKPWQARLAGVHLGPDTLDRRLFIYRRDVVPVVTITEFIPDEHYESIEDLVRVIQAQVDADWQASGLAATAPILYYGRQAWRVGRSDDIAPAWYASWVYWGTAVVGIAMGPGLAHALGWNGNVTLMLSPPAAAGEHDIRVASDRAAPVSAYLHGSSPHELRVTIDSGDLVTQQGDYTAPTAGIIQIGEKYLARVTGVVAGPPWWRLQVQLDMPEVGFDRAELVRVRDYSGRGGDTRDLADADSRLRQVYAPSPARGAIQQIREALASIDGTGSNGADDVLTTGYGLGVDADDIDRQSFLDVEATIEAAALRNRGRLFTEATPIREWIEEEARTLGFMVVMDAGQLACRRVSAMGLARQAVATIADDDLIEETTKPGYTAGPVPLFTGYTIRWDYDHIEEEFARELPFQVPPLVDQFGEARTLTIENKGLRSDDSGLPTAIARQLSAWMAYFSRPRAIGRARLSARNWQRFLPMDVVTLTLSAMHDRRVGDYGISGQIGMLLDVKEDFYGGAEASFMILPVQRQAPLAPSALLDYSRGDAGWDPATNRLYLRDNEFTVAPDLDIAWFQANDRILLSQDDAEGAGAPLVWRVTVSSVTGGAGGFLTLTGALPAPAFDVTRTYFVTLDTYDVVPVARRVDGTWIGDETDGRIGATQDWYPYT